MIEKSIVDKLHKSKIINKNSVLWWQLGFEGRRVYSQEEFLKNLREIKYKSLDPSIDSPENTPYKEEILNLWVEEDVPILLSDVNFRELSIPTFTTVKPMSHKPNGWDNLKSAVELKLPPTYTGMVYEQPHIRGIVIDLTKKFLFFYPFLIGGKHEHYSSSLIIPKNNNTPIIIDPIHPSKFYKNLVEKEWKGKRNQRKPTCIDAELEGLELVPFFEFESNKPQITIYPFPIYEDRLAKLTEDFIKRNPKWKRAEAEYFFKRYFPNKVKGRLDIPVIISGSKSGMVNLHGGGYFFDKKAYYWKLDEKRYNIAKNSLKERLGLEAN